MSELRFGDTPGGALHVALDDVPQELVGAAIRCRFGHRMALVTRKPTTLYTGRAPIQLSASHTSAVGVWCHASGCPDAGLWEIDLGKLRESLRWRAGVLVVRITDVAVRPPLED